MWDMKLKTSFFNKGIILDDLRRFGWISIAYTLALFLLVPLKVLMWHDSEEFKMGFLSKEIIKHVFYLSDSEGQGILLVTVPILLAIFLFRYMQVKISSDMIHSLPIKRDVLYRSHVFIGVLLLIIPVLINGLILVFLNKSVDLGHYYRIYDVIQWAGISILMNLVFFITCVLLGMVVGNSIMQGALTYIFLVLPMGLAVLITENIRVFIYGFMHHPGQETDKLSPIVRVFQGFQDYNNVKRDISVKEVMIYIIVCIISYFVAKFLYNKRKLEAAAQTIAFKSLQYVFKYGVAFCTMLVGGMYFQQTEGSMKWVLFGLFIGSIIGYFAAEMIVRKSVWVFNGIKGYGIYVAMMIVLILGIKFDVIGYENKLPELNNIENIYFTDMHMDFNNENYKANMSSDKNYIQAVHNFHKQLIEDKKKNKNNYKIKSGIKSGNINFIYELKDGSKIKRGYEVSYYDYKKNLKPICESKEYKKVKYPILNIASSDIEKIQLSPYNRGKERVIVNPSDIKEAIELLRQEIINENYEQIDDERKPWSNVDFMVSAKSTKKYEKLKGMGNYWDDNRAHAEWKKSYKLFEEWAKKKGYAEDLMIVPKDVAYVVVQKVENDKQWEEKRRNGTFITNNKEQHLEITDKNQIQTCLENYQYINKGGGVKYALGFYTKDKKEIDFGCFDEKSAPDFIKNYFNK